MEREWLKQRKNTKNEAENIKNDNLKGNNREKKQYCYRNIRIINNRIALKLSHILGAPILFLPTTGLEINGWADIYFSLEFRMGLKVSS